MAKRTIISTNGPFLEQVYSPQSPDIPNIDFVFVHGLNPSGHQRHAFTTWTHAASGTLWPKQLLPRDFPGARIWIFGYNSNVTKGVSNARIPDHANNLLNLLQNKRQEGPGEPGTIPIIFLGHSLGGLVIKQALLNARDNRHYWPTLEASFGLVFFGTPHRGGNVGRSTLLAARVAQIVTNESAENNLLMCLQPNSLFTQEASGRFNLLLQEYRHEILTFFETVPIKLYPFSDIVVDRASAILQAPNEMSVDLNRDHRDICKFAAGDRAYEIVQYNLRRIVSLALASGASAYSDCQFQRNTSNRPSTDTSSSSLPRVENQPGNLRKPLSLTPTTASSQDGIHRSRPESTTGNDSNVVSHNSTSNTYIKELNVKFLRAVDELDYPIIYANVKDPFRRSKLDANLVHLALVDLIGWKKAKDSNLEQYPHLRVNTVRTILDEYKVNIGYEDGFYKATPLILAAICGRETIAKLLIAKGASLQDKDGEHGRTALSWAAENNNIGMVELLIDTLKERQDQETIHITDRHGYTALDLASQNGYIEVANVLKAYKASLDAENAIAQNIESYIAAQRRIS